MTIAFREELISQIPALQLLMAMKYAGLGYEYLTPDEALSLRGGKYRNVLLEDVLNTWLREHNSIQYKGQSLPFSETNIQQAVRQLKEEPYDGLVRTNEKIYELLSLGTSLSQTIVGDTRSFSLNFIDWKHPENNIYHVTDEFVVEKRRSEETRRPDVVVFVNGIPLVVIECKRPDLVKTDGEKGVNEAITQHIRNQKDDEIPHLFTYSQLLLAVSKNDALYGTTATSKKYWGLWREETDLEADVTLLINTPLPDLAKRKLYAHREYAAAVMRYFEDLEKAGERLPTVQDRMLYSLLRPARLLELIYQFIVYDAGIKKIARYQQYFAVKETLARVAHLDPEDKRTGGVIWHTTGSGKSLTMVMLAKALTLHPNIRNPRVILVTDRVNLDTQIWKTFKACGKKAAKAKSGQDLINLIRQDQADLITTVINKFETVAKEKVTDPNPNIFVLVDEGHRSQYGSVHVKMRQVFTHACYIGFTGTPLLKKEKSTAAKFGGLLHPYSMRRAVEDKAVVPLLYEGRMAELNVNQAAIDTWFERVTQHLSAEQKTDLKRKFSRAEAVNQAEQRIAQIAYDISDHYKNNFQDTGFKAQLATASKAMALKYKKYLDEFGVVTSEIIISPPDTREGNEEVDNTRDPEVEAFWKRMMERFGSEDKYNDELIAQFGQDDGFEILIVVDKLLVGFDEPRNTVLYVDKSLKEHAVLQAIARVNRLYEGKDFGYVIDYYGILGELNLAMHTYDALEGFDSLDVMDAITDVSDEIAKLPQRHSDLWDVFKTVANKRDTEAIERFLEPEDIRQKFYEALTNYARSMQVALASVDFYRDVPEARIKIYKDDLAFFHNLRASVKQRYAETIDYKDYEKKIRKLIDSHIQSPDVKPITDLVNIFDRERFALEVEKIEGSAAKADTIAYRVKRTITERMEQDPAFYKRFSKMIDETIQAYKEGRINELQYLEKVTEAMHNVRNREDEVTPPELRHSKHAPAYFGVLRETTSHYYPETERARLMELATEMALGIERIIERHKIRDWVRNTDVQNEMKRDIEDYLVDEVQPKFGVKIDTTMLDEVLDRLIDLARKRDPL
jgi:type I restriction enzyme R subunit